VILEATVDLLGRYGYDNTTIARITKATRRPASSIYWHFDNKDDLIAAALEGMYRRPRAQRPAWPQRRPDESLRSHLTDRFAEELQTSSGEAPLRLGIMLALEGAAAHSRIQEPFQRRRTAVQQQLTAWWRQTLKTEGPDFGEQDADRLSSLLLTFLDGHYLSDVDTDEELARTRGAVLAAAVTSLVDAGPSAGTAPAAPPGTDAEQPDEPDDEHSAVTMRTLLGVTCDLVAEHGYEGATISRICEAAGLRRSSVYWRFKDKESLVTAAVATPYAGMLGGLLNLPSAGHFTDTGWADEVAHAVHRVLSMSAREPTLVKAGLLLKVQRLGAPSAEIRAGSDRVETGLAAWFDEALAEQGSAGADSRHLGWLVVRLVEGTQLGTMLGGALQPDEVGAVTATMLRAAAGDGA
jgi:AcrR family transcriptional regulator